MANRKDKTSVGFVSISLLIVRKFNENVKSKIYPPS